MIILYPISCNHRKVVALYIIFWLKNGRVLTQHRLRTRMALNEHCTQSIELTPFCFSSGSVFYIFSGWTYECTTFAPATIAPVVNPNLNITPSLTLTLTLILTLPQTRNPIITPTLTLCCLRYHRRSNCRQSKYWIAKHKHNHFGHCCH